MNKNEFEEIIKDDALIVLDTNILLTLFKYSSCSSLNIIQILNKCMDNLWIPNQVYKEFEHNKDSEISKIKKKYDNFQKDLISEIKKCQDKLLNRINESKKLQYPKCDELEHSIKSNTENLILEVKNYTNKIGAEYKMSINAAKVTEILSFVDLLVSKNRIGPNISYIEMLNIIKEGELRFKYKLPPGYEDAKNKNGTDIYGDLFIWKEILKLPSLSGSSKILFVTNDLKEDWWILKGESKKPQKIRPELSKEFTEINNNAYIEMITLKDFHELASSYFDLPSFYTELELNAEDYYCNNLIPSYQCELYDKLFDFAVIQDVVDFSEEFYKCNDNEVYGDDIITHAFSFRIEDNNAIYSAILHMPIQMYLSYEDREGDSFSMGSVYYTLVAKIEFVQKIELADCKLNNKIDYDIMSYEIIDLEVIDPYDHYLDESEIEEINYELEEYHEYRSDEVL